MKAEEFKLKNYSDIHGILYDDNSKEITWVEFAEAYHKAKVESNLPKGTLFCVDKDRLIESNDFCKRVCKNKGCKKF